MVSWTCIVPSWSNVTTAAYDGMDSPTSAWAGAGGEQDERQGTQQDRRGRGQSGPHHMFRRRDIARSASRRSCRSRRAWRLS